DYGLVTLTISGSILLGGWAAETFGVRAAIGGLAAVATLWAGVWSLATTSIRRRASFEGLQHRSERSGTPR
ncbi:MAG: hypothetical protein ACRDJP_00045, partial [Actinomycetota bacterium]